MPTGNIPTEISCLGANAQASITALLPKVVMKGSLEYAINEFTDTLRGA